MGTTYKIPLLTPRQAGAIRTRKEGPVRASEADPESRDGAQGLWISMMESREVMNIKEASDYLGVSPDTLYRYIYEDRIPAFKLGNRWKFKKTVLDRWIERKISRKGRGKKR
jgi:excisionase family DNA binding protein